jgi:flagellar biosynthetic protein FlhB
MEERFDLQLFAGPEDEGRTEEPTHRKLEQARKKGRVAKTTELSPTLITLTTCFLLSFIGLSILKSFCELITLTISHVKPYPEFTPQITQSIFLQMGLSYIKIVGPIMVCTCAFAFFSEIAQVGFHFASEAFSFDLSKCKLNFGKIWDRINFSTKTLVEYGKCLFKIAVISWFAYTTIRQNYSEIILSMSGSIHTGFFLIAHLSYEIMIKTAIFLAIMAILDYLYQRYEYKQSLRMTKHEMKDEWKQMEGDPLMRARIRERQQQMAKRRMMAEVAKADVVITNPTHIAVAIKYDSTTMSAPTVVAKGEAGVAENIKKIAQENGVPIVENPPLAQALYKAVQVGEEVATELYQAVAEVLAFVYKLKRKAA